jgi:hypothetical protein
MAAKKTAKRPSLVRNVNSKTDADYVQDAYGDAVKNQVATYITNCLSGIAEPEKKFCSGLAIIRKARNQALELVKQ